MLFCRSHHHALALDCHLTPASLICAQMIARSAVVPRILERSVTDPDHQ